jgi:hypothetical protein
MGYTQSRFLRPVGTLLDRSARQENARGSKRSFGDFFYLKLGIQFALDSDIGNGIRQIIELHNWRDTLLSYPPATTSHEHIGAASS